MPPSDRVGRERGLRAAVLRGDVQAWQALYDATFAEVFAYIRWRCAGLEDLAEDIAQETWLVAVRRIRAFQPEQGAFAGWLRGIAANLLRNHFRARSPGTNHALPDQLPGADLALRREQAEQVARVLAELPERYEAALRAKYLESRSVAEIAELWRESPKAVESVLSRARAAFRAAYGSADTMAEAIREGPP